MARREIVRAEGTTVAVTEAVAAGRDVRRRGETIRVGELLLGRGHRVAPHEVGALGATGRADVLCARRPRVAILATGAELVALGAAASPFEVHDSSRHGLAAQAVAAGAVVVASATVGDDLEDTVAALARAARRARRQPAGRGDHQRRHLGGRPRPGAPGARAPRGGGGRTRRPRQAGAPHLPRPPRRPGRAGAARKPGLGRGRVPPAGAAAARRQERLVAPRAADRGGRDAPRARRAAALRRGPRGARRRSRTRALTRSPRWPGPRRSPGWARPRTAAPARWCTSRGSPDGPAPARRAC